MIKGMVQYIDHILMKSLSFIVDILLHLILLTSLFIALPSRYPVSMCTFSLFLVSCIHNIGVNTCFN